MRGAANIPRAEPRGARARGLSLPIRAKLLALVFSMLCVASIAGLLLIAWSRSMASASDEEARAYFSINRLGGMMDATYAYLGEFLEAGNLETLAVFNQAVDDFAAALRGLGEGEEVEARLLVGAIGNSFDSYHAECVSSIRARLHGGSSPYPPYYRAGAISEYIGLYASQLLGYALERGTVQAADRKEAAEATRSGAYLALAVFAALSTTLGGLLAGHIATPLVRLSAAAARFASGDIETRIEGHRSNDEVGRLSDSFIAMGDSIRLMVADLRAKAQLEQRLREDESRMAQAERSLREAQFTALQSQINPHFLFNTMNTVSRLILLREGKDAHEVIESLCSLLRYATRRASAVVSLAEELEIVRKYAFIQNYRFGDRITIDVACDIERPETVPLPCLTLQPLVENAVIHGLEPKVGGGSISVRARLEGGRAVIEVSDDGLGMAEGRIDDILAMRESASTGHTSAIGLSNVVARLRSLAGREDCVGIFSSPGGGARIVLSLPVPGADAAVSEAGS